jgi:hypothetical protein
MHAALTQWHHVVHGLRAPVHICPAIGARLSFSISEHSAKDLDRERAVGLADRVLEALAGIFSAGLTTKYSNALPASLADDLLTQ